MAKWLLSTDHSSALFATRHMMVTWVRGFFTEVRGTLMFDPLNVAAATLTVEIDAASLYTGVASAGRPPEKRRFSGCGELSRHHFRQHRGGTGGPGSGLG